MHTDEGSREERTHLSEKEADVKGRELKGFVARRYLRSLLSLNKCNRASPSGTLAY